MGAVALSILHKSCCRGEMRGAARREELQLQVKMWRKDEGERIPIFPSGGFYC
jgi:hypothetical protein